MCMLSQETVKPNSGWDQSYSLRRITGIIVAG